MSLVSYLYMQSIQPPHAAQKLDSFSRPVMDIVRDAQNEAFRKALSRAEFDALVGALKAAPKRPTVMVDGEECYVFPIAYPEDADEDELPDGPSKEAERP